MWQDACNDKISNYLEIAKGILIVIIGGSLRGAFARLGDRNGGYTAAKGAFMQPLQFEGKAVSDLRSLRATLKATLRHNELGEGVRVRN